MHHNPPKSAYSQLFSHALYTFEVYNIFYKLSKGLEIFSKLRIHVYRFPSYYYSYALVALVCIEVQFQLSVNVLHKSAATNEALLFF